MKKILLVLPIMLLLVGCTTKEEEGKYAYLEYKNELEKKEEFSANEEIDFNTYFNIVRENEEIINYSIIINNPKINMYKVKALLIHDYVQDDVFPSVGILNNQVDLLKDSNNKIELKGTIQTTEDVSNIKYKLYLEYQDENGLENKIYYQVSRG